MLLEEEGDAPTDSDGVGDGVGGKDDGCKDCDNVTDTLPLTLTPLASGVLVGDTDDGDSVTDLETDGDRDGEGDIHGNCTGDCGYRGPLPEVPTPRG